MFRCNTQPYLAFNIKGKMVFFILKLKWYFSDYPFFISCNVVTPLHVSYITWTYDLCAHELERCVSKTYLNRCHHWIKNRLGNHTTNYYSFNCYIKKLHKNIHIESNNLAFNHCNAQTRLHFASRDK
jgi:hypothetical protein